MTGRILIADAVASERIVLKARLASQAYQVDQAASAAEVIDMAQNAPPDLILLPERLGDCDGVDLFTELRAKPQTRSIPVILRLEGADCMARIRALEAGVEAVIDTRSAPALLGARIRNMLRRSVSDADLARTAEAAKAANGTGLREAAPHFARQGSIVIIAPSLQSGQLWQQGLATQLRDRIRVLPEVAALTTLAEGPAPDAIVVAENPQAPERALSLISDLRSRSQTMRAALILVQDAPRPAQAVTALDIGIDDLIDTGFDARELALRLRRELARKARADGTRAALQDGLKLAVTDSLTGLFNRRYALSYLDRLRADGPFAVMLLDLDRFKAINDSHGHPAGDAVLIEVARRMSRCLRQNDLLARFGGEEFLAAIPGGNLAKATRAADRLRKAVSALPIALPNGAVDVRVTISIGLVMSDCGAPDSATLVGHADAALYEAKAEGRDQVTVRRCAA